MNAGVEANQLIGPMAIQNGLIDQEQIIAAYEDWNRDKSRPLADLIVHRVAPFVGTAEDPSSRNFLAWPDPFGSNEATDHPGASDRQVTDHHPEMVFQIATRC